MPLDLYERMPAVSKDTACCLNKSQLRRLNGFQARCVRKVLGVKPAFYSRISNREVLQRARSIALSDTLLEEQLRLLGRSLRAPLSSPLHSAAFTPGTPEPLVNHY